MTIEDARLQAWNSWNTLEELQAASDEVVQLTMEHHIYDKGGDPREGGWHSLTEARKRPSMVPFLVSLKLKGLL